MSRRHRKQEPTPEHREPSAQASTGDGNDPDDSNAPPGDGSATAGEPSKGLKFTRPTSPRRRWTVVDYLLAVALVVLIGVLGWQVWRTYLRGAGGELPPPSAGDLCQRLQGRGDVLALSRDSLRRARSTAHGCWRRRTSRRAASWSSCCRRGTTGPWPTCSCSAA